MRMSSSLLMSVCTLASAAAVMAQSFALFIRIVSENHVGASSGTLEDIFLM